MAIVASQHIRCLGRHPGFLKMFIFNKNKNAAYFTEISKKHVFAASDRNMIKKKEEIRTNFFKKLQFSISVKF